MTDNVIAERASTPSVCEGLNPEQAAAVQAVDGPVLVLAGAGTGKTRVLTTRLAHLIRDYGVYASRILAVTFTNKAAAEMRHRIHAMVGDAVGGLWLGTFHALCARILRQHIDKLGYTENFTILDTDDQLRIIKGLLKDYGLDEKACPPRIVSSVIQRWKDRGWLPADVPVSEHKKELRGKAIRFYQDYQARLKSLNALDFGDMILLCLVLFRDFPEVLRHYQQQFRYILVDEYQDTNVSQYLWLRLLAQGHGNLCCVGDDDQSIYGWRGAEVDNILRFDQDFPGATVIKLEQNYRSTQTILTAASHLIQNNQGRLGKTLWTDDQTGEKIAVHHVWDSAEEARLLAKTIEKRAAGGQTLGQMAMLVRASFQTRELEEALMNAAIPYQVIGGLRFYDRQEIRDALAYLRLTTQIDDDLALDRIINLPKRGIGSTTVQTLAAEAERAGISIYRLLLEKNQTGELLGRGGKPLQQFVVMIEGWRNQLSRRSPAEMMAMILDESGYTAMWKETKTPDAEARLDNLKELIAALHTFDTLNSFLEHVMLVADTAETGDGDKVSIMTLHGAKGLEFDMVFLPGWEEGIFPNQRAIDESGDKGVEEERRLAYVGLTRARKQAMITYANSRRKFNTWQYNPPSRFLQELPTAHIHHQNHNKAAGSPAAFGQYGGGRHAKTLDVWDESQDVVPILPTYNASRAQGMRQSFAAQKRPSSPQNTFFVGQTVSHTTYGEGTIAALLGQDKVEVTFLEDGLTRTVMGKWLEGG